MAKQIHTLSKASAEKLPAVFARVLGDGGAGGSSRTATPGRGDRTLIGMWCKIADSDDDGTGVSRRSYSLDLYQYFGASTALISGVPGINSFEKANTSTFMAGYDIVAVPACGDIIGILPIPVGIWVQVMDVTYVSGTQTLIFSVRNDPTFQES